MAARRTRFTTEVVAFFNTDNSPNEDTGNAEETFTDFVGIALSESEDDTTLDEPKPSSNDCGEDISMQPLQLVPGKNVGEDSFEPLQAQCLSVDDTMPVASDGIINPWESSDSAESSAESDSTESSNLSDTITEVAGIHSHALDNTSNAEPTSQLGERRRQQPRSRGVGQARNHGRRGSRGHGRAQGRGHGSALCVQQPVEGSADLLDSSEDNLSDGSGTSNDESRENEQTTSGQTTRRIRGRGQGRGGGRGRGRQSSKGRMQCISYKDLIPNTAKEISERDISFREPSEFLPLREPGPYLPFPDGHDVTELDLLQLFITDDMIGRMVEATNLYAEAKKESKPAMYVRFK